MKRDAQIVIVRYPFVFQGNLAYRTIVYEVGKMCRVPNYDYVTEDMVTDIVLSDAWKPHVMVYFDKYGETMLVENINEIIFEDEQYREIIGQEITDREAEDSSGE